MDVLMPQLGETVSEGKITVWYKSVGDSIAVGDNLFEIETDKTSMEVPSTVTGVLSEIRVATDETALVGAVVAVISNDGGKTADTPAVVEGSKAAPSPTTATAANSSVPARAALAPARVLEPFREVFTPERNYGPARVNGGVATTPLARRLAAEAGVDLSHQRGSGPDGRIVGKDIAAMRGSAQSPALGRPQPVTGMSADQVKALYEPGSYVEQPLDGMRRAIARRLTESKQTVPHFYLTTDLELDALLQLREDINAGAPKQQGAPAFKLSLNDLLIKAWAAALQRVPDANAVWAEDRILRFKHSDIGIAVAVEGGLVTPVIRQAEMKTPRLIASEMQDLAARARIRKLKPEEMQGGATAISNLGMYGVREFSAIINPPHSTILAVGAMQRRAVEGKDAGVRFASQMTVTLSCDHRVVDGVLGAQLLAALRELILRPAAAMA